MNARASVRRAARIAGFVGTSASMLGAYSLHDAVTRQDRELLRDRWTRVWCDVMLRTFGLRLSVVGEPFAHASASNHGQLVVCNHRGVADIIVMMRTFGGHLVSRADLARWPLVGIGARKLGTIFVDRSNKVSGAGAIRQMRDLLAARATVVVFPEGTTFAGDEVRPFHAGAFLAAIGVPNVAIIPAGLAYARDSGAAFTDETFPQHLSRMAGAEPSSLVLSIGPSLPIAGKAPALAERARAAVADQVSRARSAVD